MQIFTMRYNLSKSIRKSKQISGQTILSSLQDLEFNPNFGKIATFQWLKIKSFSKPIILIDCSIFLKYNI